MYKTAEKLRKFKSTTPSQWRESAEARLANQEERRKARKIALCLLDAMEKQCITEDSLAKLTGMSNDELSQILKGQQMPSPETFSTITSILNIGRNIPALQQETL